MSKQEDMSVPISLKIVSEQIGKEGGIFTAEMIIKLLMGDFELITLLNQQGESISQMKAVIEVLTKRMDEYEDDTPLNVEFMEKE